MESYFLYPAVHGREVAFVTEDDLWTFTLGEDSEARRLTSSLGIVANPRFSPDGKWIAFRVIQGVDNTTSEVYVIPSTGGVPRRLTHFGGTNTGVAGWTQTGEVVVYSDAKAPTRGWTELYRISVEGGRPVPLGLGRANAIVYGKKTILGRNVSDLTHWKRYRGGTRGKLWIEEEPGTFRKFLELDGNINSPMWLGGRVYFVCDHEGIGNLYSVDESGKDLKRHTSNTDFYVRNASTDGQKIVYHAGGRLFLFDPETGSVQEIKPRVALSGKQLLGRFVEAKRFLEEHSLSPNGEVSCTTVRGKSFVMGNWEGPVLQISPGSQIPERSRLSKFLSTGYEVVYVTDESGEERVGVYDTRTGSKTILPEDHGHVEALVPSPKGRRFALMNNRLEVWTVDLDEKKSVLVDRSEYGIIEEADWSPDGEWVAYTYPEDNSAVTVRLAKRDGSVKIRVTTPSASDYSPSFDPDGRYLYYLSTRHLDPVYDRVVFDLGFQRAVKPFAVTLRSDTPDPFAPTPKPVDDQGQAKPADFAIDTEGIEKRCVPFPVEEGNYAKVAGAKNGKVFLLSFPIQGAIGSWLMREQAPSGVLEVFDIGAKSKEQFAQGVSDFSLSADRQHISLRMRDRLRVVSTQEKPSDAAQEANKKGGWIDLSRIKAFVEPRTEWKQMLRETWRLMRENYWRQDLKGVNWEEVYARYSPLVDRISTRYELSDVIREMQGEMGTSHAYELGGDLVLAESQPVGALGCEFRWTGSGYEVTKIFIGDPSNEDERSPLAAPGTSIKEGDILVAVNGIRLTKEFTPEAALWNHAAERVVLRFSVQGVERDIEVTTLANERRLLYRWWVESNRRYVHERSKGKIGYVHIPDMGPQGFAEFHRLYPYESRMQGLVVDVRFNGGGHVSQLILEKLARKHIGYDKPRRGKLEQYPVYSVKGPIVALTNEQAGSDGDIFCHAFKLMGLGPLVGTRTWGGVVGINPRVRLVDGTFVTQPQFAFYFKDVGWGVENYGTDPNIEVEIAPQDYARGLDPQLDRAVDEALALLERSTTLPEPE